MTNPSESEVAYVLAARDISDAASYCNPRINYSDVNILIVLIGDKLDVSNDNNSSIYTIEISYPNEPDRQDFIHQLVNNLNYDALKFE